jgi:hypothetical protein
LSHQRAKNKNKTKQNKKIPSSNVVQFQLALQHPVLVLMLSHQRKRKTTTKKESGDSFVNVYLRLWLTCLLSVIYLCRLYLWRSLEWALHSPSPIGFVYLEFFWLHPHFVFSSIQPYPPVAITVFFLLFRVHMGMCLFPTLWWSMPHFSCCYKPSPLQATPAFSGQLAYLQFMLGSAPLPPPVTCAAL